MVNAAVKAGLFIPDPAKSQVNSAMTGTKVFKKGTGGDVNVTGWTWILVNPTAACTYYYNSDTTKTKKLYQDKDNIIWLQPNNVTQVTIVFSTATADVQGG